MGVAGLRRCVLRDGMELVHRPVDAGSSKLVEKANLTETRRTGL